MRSVRSILLVVVCLMVSHRLFGGPIPGLPGPSANEPAISIKETVRFHVRKSRLNELCRVERDVLACTDFVDETFDCRCERRDDGWRIVAVGTLNAVIHVTDQRYLAHERLHLGDIHAAIPDALAPFLERRFSSEQACSTLANVMSLPPFAVQVMNRIRVESNERLGCTKKGSETVARR